HPTILKIVTSFNTNMSKEGIKALAYKLGQAYISAFPPYDFEPQLNILVEADAPVYIEKLMMERLKLLLLPRYNIRLKSISESDLEFINSVDFIIATGLTEKEHEMLPKIFVYPHLSKSNIEQILEACNKKIFNDL
ncbi:MAG: hypothetical protein ACRC90_01850, partial [Lactococcus garvieae]